MKIINVKDVEVKEIEGGHYSSEEKYIPSLFSMKSMEPRKSKWLWLSLRRVPAIGSIPTRVGKSCMSPKAKEL